MNVQKIIDMLVKHGIDIPTAIALGQVLFDIISQKKESEMQKEMFSMQNKIITILEEIKEKDQQLDYRLSYNNGPIRITSSTGSITVRPEFGFKFSCVKQSGVTLSKVFTISKVKKHYNIDSKQTLQELKFSPRNVSSRNMYKEIRIGNGLIQGELEEIGHDSGKKAFYIELFPPETFLNPRKYSILHVLLFSPKGFAQLITLIIRLGMKKDGVVIVGNDEGGTEMKDECLIFHNMEELKDLDLWYSQLATFGYSSDERKKILGSQKEDALNSCREIEKYLNKTGIHVQHF